jgi:16S rRNA (cytosine967-C5)-methyltransferase
MPVVATPSRRIALQVLLDVEGPGPTLADRLAADDAEALDPRDRGFLHELVLGTLRRRGAIDAALAPLLSTGLDRLDPAVRAALRLGAHQILHLRVPDRAAVSEAVESVRAHAPRATGLVNAVLRRLAREGAPAEPDPEKEPLEWLTATGSLPAWLAERWLGRLGATEAVARARASLAEPPATFRLNPRRPEAEERVREAGLDPEPLTLPGAWRARSGRPADLAAEGVIHLQDEGSQLVGRLAARPGAILDACAAPGGKAMLMGDVVGEWGDIVAAERSLARLRTMASLVGRWGATNVRLVGADALQPPFVTPFDTLLLDAPCTGLGTIARHPDIRWRLRPDDLPRHARRQGALLESLAPLVRAGGRLIYATCSSEPEENEEVVTAFLSRHPEFRPLPLPGWAQVFADGPYARTRPEVHGGDAFFAAVLER